MGKWISNLFLGALAIGLSIFTGSRTLDLLAWALPAGQGIYQWLGLAAFEGGMYFWAFYFVAGAKGTPQRSIAVIMAIFSIIAVCVATIVDLSIDAAQSGKVAQLSPTNSQAVIIFLGVVIAINVAAFIACHLLSIDNLRNMKEQSAEDTIHDAGLKAITAVAPHIAAAAAPHLAEEWANRTWQRIVPGVGHQTYYLPAAPATMPATASAPATMPATASAPAQAKIIDATPPKPAKEQSGFFKNLFSGKKEEPAPVKDTFTVPSQPPRRRVVPTPPHQQSAVARARLQRRQQRFARQSIDDTQEVGSGPLASRPVQVKKGNGQYIVNKKKLPPLKIHD